MNMDSGWSGEAARLHSGWAFAWVCGPSAGCAGRVNASDHDEKVR
ncbi:hypothetical protein BSIN_4008 [Burkholderia singularis]|uniref:Uncharacterized protein n=1 Tax=Burkholderia singularis TaxID=1503053 RepID=A0A238H7H4_9BURK|nr:hypothetical protein BSIN_4008 [Burkholderia singularis]